MNFQQKSVYDMNDLLQIVKILRGENGCPWDKEQTHQSVRRNFLEETYEALEAIDKEDAALLKEELGDVLYQVVFHAEMEEEAGTFCFDDVADGICKKLIHRHPHVFGDASAGSAEEVLQRWDEIKKDEKGLTEQSATLKSIPAILPALMRSNKVQERAAKSGFDYPDVDYAFNDFESELFDLKHAINSNDTEAINKELGDLIFNCVNVARFLGLDPEKCLNDSTDEFIRRFEKVESIAKEQKIDLKNCSIQKHNDLWKQAKQK